MQYDEVNDSGERSNFASGAVRDMRKGKGRFDLIPASALRRVAKHYENGSLKYGDWNWSLGMPFHTFLDSAIRHLYNYADGDRSEDHLAAVVFNVNAIMHEEEMIERGLMPKDLMDLPTFTTPKPAEVKPVEPVVIPPVVETPKAEEPKVVESAPVEPETPKVVEAPNVSIDQLSALEQFIETRCVMGADQTVSRHELIEAYNAYAMENSSMELLANKLKALEVGVQKKRVGLRNVSFFTGIGLKADKPTSPSSSNVQSLPVANFP